VLAGAAGADEAVLRALVALGLRILERGPVGLAIAKARDVAGRNLLQRQPGDDSLYEALTGPSLTSPAPEA